MLLNKPGERFEHNSQSFVVGESVYALSSHYKGLYGTITAIRDGMYKDTGNPDVNILCCFFSPINKEVKRQIAKRMSAYYGDPVRFEDIAIDLVIMAPEMLRPAKKCRVYQLNEHGKDFMFQPYDLIKKRGLKSPPRELYRVVYDGDLHTDELEEIFYILNCAHPEGYKGRSLSMSDIVELYDETKSSYHYCDTFGFTQVPFEPAAKGA